MPKIQPQLVELVVDRFTSHWTLNAWQVTIRPRLNLDRNSTRKTYPSTGKERLLEKRRFLHLSTEPQLGMVDRLTNTPNWLSRFTSASIGSPILS